MKKHILVALFFGATFLNAETSAFASTNSNDLQNKIELLSNEYYQINAKIDETNQRLEGISSTLDGINSQYAKSNSRLNALENANDNNISAQIAELKAYAEQTRQIQDANNKQIKKVLKELSSLVDSINSSYVSKSELLSANLGEISVMRDENASKKIALNLSDLDQNLTSENNQSVALSINSENNTTKIKETPKAANNEWQKKKNNQILDLGIADINKNAYAAAKDKFEYLIKKQYKPARANFYLGENEYKQKNYAAAINYYKISSSISQKGDYFPKLLYHTAISLDKVGDTKSATAFYKALKTNYPNSPEAKASPNRK